MFARLVLFLLVVVAPLSASAQCAGVDLRLQMSPEDMERMAVAVQDVPFASGNHWVAEKGARTVHVVGTIHVYDPRLDPVMTRLRPAVEAADVVLLEATPVEQKALETAIAEKPELVFLTTGPTLPEMLPEEDWQRLSEAASARGIPPFMAAKFQPWYLSLLMGIPGCAMAEVADGLRGLDDLIGNTATDAGVPMRALEPFDTLFGLFSDDPMEEQVRLLMVSVLSNQESEDALFTLKEQYFEQAPAQAWEFSRYLAHQRIDLSADEIDTLFVELEDMLLTRRNTGWVARIEAAPENNVFVAVGGAHLMGTNGVLQLLENAGYALSRHPF